MPDVIARLIDSGINFIVRHLRGTVGKGVRMAQITLVSALPLLSCGGFLQDTGWLNIEALVVRKTPSKQALYGKPLIGR
jgi:hypothetical protein